MAAANVRGSSTNTAATGTAQSVAEVSGTTIGDVVVVISVMNDLAGESSVVDNNGATPFTKDYSREYFGAAGGGRMTVFTRRIQSGDPTTYNFTGAASTRWTLHAVCIESPNPSTIFDVAPAAGNSQGPTGTVSSLTSLTITTLEANAIHIVVGATDGASVAFTGTPGSGGWTILQNSGNQRAGVGYKLMAAPGATGAGTWTVGSASGMGSLSFSIGSDAASSTVYPERGVRGVERGVAAGNY